MRVQDRFISLANGSCLALCLAYIFDTKSTALDDLMIDVVKGHKEGFIEDDGFVRNPTAYCKMLDGMHDNWTYEIINIKSLDDLSEGISYPVFYSIDGKNGHFVVANRDGIVWNPLEKSKNVEQGKPISYRKVQWK